MPYVSDAQRRLFHAKANRGEISKATVHHWDEATKGKKLPEHVKKGAVGSISTSTGLSSQRPPMDVSKLLRQTRPGRVGQALGATAGIAGAGLAAYGIHKLLQKAYGPKSELVKKEACVKLASALATLPEKTRVKLAAVLYVYTKRAALLPSKPSVRKGTPMQKIQTKVAAYIQKQAMPAAAAAIPAAAAAVPAVSSWLLGTALPWLGSTVGAGAAMAAGSMGLEKLLRKKEPEPQPQPQVGPGMPGSGMSQH